MDGKKKKDELKEDGRKGDRGNQERWRKRQKIKETKQHSSRMHATCFPTVEF